MIIHYYLLWTLEIGCGEGIDLKYIVNNFNLKNIFAINIGKNINTFLYGGGKNQVTIFTT